ncbi:uncharacterized protein LOC144446576 [Glandiceps talaboti]
MEKGKEEEISDGAVSSEVCDVKSLDNNQQRSDVDIDMAKLAEMKISDDENDEDEFFDATDDIQDITEVNTRTIGKEENELCDEDEESVSFEISQQDRTDDGETSPKIVKEENESKETQNDPEVGVNEDNTNNTTFENCEVEDQSKEKESSDVIDNGERTETDDSAESSEPEDFQLPDEKEDAENQEEEKVKVKPTTLEEDEECLKELEANMTDEEKEIRKDEAQELKNKGNEFYKNEEYGEAIDAYTNALLTCPLCYKKERAIMYSNRAACHLRMDENEEAIVDCSKALELHSVYVKALLRRAQTYEKVDKLDEALEDYQKVLQLEPATLVAREACMRLPEEIKARNEKLKTEMMDKLKDLGNMVLRPFGLSTNNFQLQQDPNTGSYSVNFQQNPTNNGK